MNATFSDILLVANVLICGFNFFLTAYQFVNEFIFLMFHLETDIDEYLSL